MCKYPIGAALQSSSVSQCNPMHRGNAETCPVSELKMVLREVYWWDVEEGHVQTTSRFLRLSSSLITWFVAIYRC